MIFVWTLGDVIGVVTFAFFALWLLCLYIPIWFKQWRCKHDGEVNETRDLRAICGKCGKDLGFIGTWRATKARKAS